MKREYLKVFCLMLGFSLLLSGALFYLGEKYKEAREKEMHDEQKIMDEIGDFYNLFNEKSEQFSSKHDEFIKLVDDATTFYKNVPDNYNALIETATNYEKFLVEVDDMDDYLYNNCYRKFYSNADVNKNCLSYLRNMEKVVNTFIDDIYYLNQRIVSYNEWTDTEKESVIAERHYDKYDEFKSTKYTEYVDKDGDGVQLGAKAG